MKYWVFIFFYSFGISLTASGDPVNRIGSRLQELTKAFPVVSLSLIALLLLVIVLLYRSRQRLSRTLKRQASEIRGYRSHLLEQVGEANLESSQREFEAINRIVSAIGYRHIEAASHITRMAFYSRLIAKQLYPPDSPMVGLIFLASPMHDVGKIGISDNILSKPKPLSSNEFEEMKQHTLIGYDILKESSSRIIQLAAIIALTHHEKFDGSGYPQGLKGKDIPLAGRIVAVADYFDALVSKRSYKDAWTVEQTVEYLQQHSGTFFDPQCVRAFLRSLDEVVEIKDKYTEYKNIPV